ncbi:MAG: RlmE family RNA methyltransferase [Holosporales bacterium]|jgi:23S rRNA (uridine2552-2'-O)-methyltransferase|nr:RlmE family RNA methyltransferase [Holosporales bacterium]
MAKVVKSKNLKASSKKWVQRQINDKYVELAIKEGYRSRAAYKIQEIQARFKIFKPDSVVLDLGAAPGGWSQVASKICKKVIAVDLLDIAPLPGVHIISGDFFDDSTLSKAEALIGTDGVDIILSDMAPNSCGLRQVDHIRIMNLAEAVFDFGEKLLNHGGSMVIKILRGGTEAGLLAKLKKSFQTTRHFKPASSRTESSEMYVIARGFRGS